MPVGLGFRCLNWRGRFTHIYDAEALSQMRLHSKFAELWRDFAPDRVPCSRTQPTRNTYVNSDSRLRRIFRCTIQVADSEIVFHSIGELTPRATSKMTHFVRSFPVQYRIFHEIV